MYLSQDNEYQRNMNALNAAEAKARTDLEFERLKARTAYQDAVAQAIREGDAAKAKALYQEAIRVDEALVSSSANQISIDLQREATQWNRMAEQADTLAKYGDFSGYAALGYSPEQIADMRRTWEAMNPDLMALMGYGGYAAGGSGGSGGSGSGKGGSGNGGNGKTGNGGNSNTNKMGNTHGLSSDGSGNIDWVTVPGYGRLSVTELQSMVNSGKVIESKGKDGKYHYRKAR
jgi:hypothetical protein